MRIQLWPSYQFWYHVSLGGLLYLAYALFYFVNAFSGQRRPGFCKFWFLLLTAGFVATSPPAFFLKWPDLVLVDGNAVFVYEMSWTVGVLFAIAAGIMFHMIYIIVTNCKKDPVFRKQIEPTLAGIVLMFSGNLALLIPRPEGLPHRHPLLPAQRGAHVLRPDKTAAVPAEDAHQRSCVLRRLADRLGHPVL